MCHTQTLSLVPMGPDSWFLRIDIDVIRGTYLCDELCHVLHDAGVISELPYEHDDLFHLYLALVVSPEHIVDETSIRQEKNEKRQEQEQEQDQYKKRERNQRPRRMTKGGTSNTVQVE